MGAYPRHTGWMSEQRGSSFFRRQLSFPGIYLHMNILGDGSFPLSGTPCVYLYINSHIIAKHAVG